MGELQRIIYRANLMGNTVAAYYGLINNYLRNNIIKIGDIEYSLFFQYHEELEWNGLCFTLEPVEGWNNSRMLRDKRYLMRNAIKHILEQQPTKMNEFILYLDSEYSNVLDGKIPKPFCINDNYRASEMLREDEDNYAEWEVEWMDFTE